MRILIIKLSPIEGLNSSTIRTLSLAKGFVDLGHEVDYLTIPMSNVHVKMDTINLEKQINIIRTKPNQQYDSVISTGNKGVISKFITNILRKAYHKLSLYNYTYSIAMSINTKLLQYTFYDLVISVSDPKTSHIAMKKLMQNGLNYGRWIQYWGDPMALDITNKSMYPKWYIAKKEEEILQEADSIIYVSPFTLKGQMKLFPKLADRMRFLPIPYFEEKYYKETSNLKYTIGYFGAYNSRIRNILPLYECCENMSDIVNLNIVGDSDLVLENKQNIKIYPRGNIESFEEESDLLVCMLNNKGTQIPGKIYHYAATNKPILVILDGEQKNEMKKYIDSFQRYYTCDNDQQSIKEKIHEIMNENKTFKPSKEFSPKNISSKFIEQAKQ